MIPSYTDVTAANSGKVPALQHNRHYFDNISPISVCSPSATEVLKELPVSVYALTELFKIDCVC